MENQTIRTRICPICGQFNHADIWNCDACGNTLAVGTITEVEINKINPTDLRRLEIKMNAEEQSKNIERHEALKRSTPQSLSNEHEPVFKHGYSSDRAEAADKYLKRMMSGFLWAAGGLLLTSMSFQAASPGGTYIIFYGAILVGGFDFLVGFLGWISNQ